MRTPRLNILQDHLQQNWVFLMVEILGHLVLVEVLDGSEHLEVEFLQQHGAGVGGFEQQHQQPTAILNGYVESHGEGWPPPAIPHGEHPIIEISESPQHRCREVHPKHRPDDLILILHVVPDHMFVQHRLLVLIITAPHKQQGTEDLFGAEAVHVLAEPVVDVLDVGRR